MVGKRSRMARAAMTLRAAVASAGLEQLEERQFLSASHLQPKGGSSSGGPPAGGPPGAQVTAITFSQAPTAVQTGLDTLATADGLTDPTSTQIVTLHNVGGVETYSVAYTAAGTKSILTVDQNGNAVTAPTTTTTTYGTLSGTGTGSDAAAATEISAIATALGLTAPTSTTTVNVTTTSSGAVIYSVALSSSSTTTSYGPGALVSVDASGNPVGNQNLPLSVIPTTIASALEANTPTGATALTSTSIVHVQTIDGVTLYSATFTSTGTKTTITVNSAGTLTSLPSHTTTTFSALSTVVQNELQTLATANGYTSTIASTQSIDVFTEANGTVLYSVTLSTSTSTTSTTTTTFPMSITVTSDSNGNPTTLPGGGPGGLGGPGGPGGGCGPGSSGGTGPTTGSSSGTSSGSSSGGTTKTTKPVVTSKSKK